MGGGNGKGLRHLRTDRRQTAAWFDRQGQSKVRSEDNALQRFGDGRIFCRTAINPIQLDKYNLGGYMPQCSMQPLIRIAANRKRPARKSTGYQEEAFRIPAVRTNQNARRGVGSGKRCRTSMWTMDRRRVCEQPARRIRSTAPSSAARYPAIL